ncbi:MAG: site-specific integrase [Bacteroidales bacterium]|nr:site-specific integrase [Bacteroidales bacterium]
MARKKNPTKAKEPVKIRFKKLANGNQSIYLDIYKDGVREYEFLKLYIIPETTPFYKQQNAATMEAANAIKAQRVIELTNEGAGIKGSSTKGKMLLSDWIEAYKAKRTGSTANAVSNLSKILISYSGHDTMLKDISKKYCLGLIDFMKNTYKKQDGEHLKSSSMKLYCDIFAGIINAAVRAGLVSTNPFAAIDKEDKIETTHAQRVYLTAEELERIKGSECPNQEVKRAFLFSCYCGLRISDIRALKWGDIINDGGQIRVEIVMQKTNQPLSIPLSAKAIQYLPDRGTATDEQAVFVLPTTNAIEYNVAKLAANAGITKYVTFHTSRHTFATLLLTKDVNLAVIQKLLGHSKINTTQIYAEIIDKKKVEAVNVLNEL